MEVENLKRDFLSSDLRVSGLFGKEGTTRFSETQSNVKESVSKKFK